MSAEELLIQALDQNADLFTNAVRITVSALRKRLGEPWIIATVTGAGYRIDTQLILEPGYEPAVLREFAPTAAIVLGGLLVFGLVGGWLLAGRMLVPLSRITHATRTAAIGSLSHRIRLPGPSDEFGINHLIGCGPPRERSA